MINNIYIARYLAGLLLVLTLLYSCDRGTDVLFFEEDLVEIADFIIDNQETYSRFYDIMTKGELTDPLNAYNPHGLGFTLFLPTDEAFDRYIADSEKYGSFNDLLNDVDFVRELGRYHLVHRSFASYEFPYGVLSDTTASGDLLTIGYSSSLDTTIYKVNNVGSIVEINLEMLNGYVHVIDQVLEPIVFTGYDWLKEKGEYTILAGALEITGLSDTLGQYRKTADNRLIQNNYTILAEHDSVYSRNGIESLDDLVQIYHTPGREYTDPNSGLYQFAAYHILEGSHFLVEFTARNYNTYTRIPVSIMTGADIRINKGVDTFAFVYTESDTNAIDYISFYYQESDVLTKTGPIHIISEVMEPFRDIPRSNIYLQFYNEYVINTDAQKPGDNTYEYFDQDEFNVISWSGPKSIEYKRFGSGSSSFAWGRDYISIEGNFSIEYYLPKIFPGTYMLQIRAEAYNSKNATVLVSFDGKRIGRNLDLSKGGTSTNPYNTFDLGLVEILKPNGHRIMIESLIHGSLIWDAVVLVPEERLDITF